MADFIVALKALPWNNTLPQPYQNCSVPSLSRDCWEVLSSYTTLAQIFYLTQRDERVKNAWTCADIETYCSRMNAEQVRSNLLQKIHDLWGDASYRQTLSGDLLAPLSIVSNILLLIALCSLTLDGEIFWYLRSIALAQICQAIIVLISEHQWYPYPKSSLGSNVVQSIFSHYTFTGGRAFGTCMSFFMCLDRYVAVCYPLKHKTLVWWRWFAGALAYSILIAALQQISINFVFTTVWYRNRLSWIYTNIIQPFTAMHGIILIIVSFAFSARIAIALRRRSRKIATMMSSATVKSEHRKMVFMCQVQILETLTLTYDMSFLFFGPLADVISNNWADCVKVACDATIMTPSVVFPTQTLLFVLHEASVLMTFFRGMCHIELFFLYMIFAPKIRRAFKDVCVRSFRSTKTTIGKLGKCLKIGTSNDVIELR